MVDDLKDLEHGDKIRIETESREFDNLVVLGDMGGKRKPPAVGLVMGEDEFDDEREKDGLVYDATFNDKDSQTLKIEDGELYIEYNGKDYKVEEVERR